MIKLSKTNSLFLFGARGVGKSTLVKNDYNSKQTLWLDFLSYKEEERFSQNPDELISLLEDNNYKKVVIDEIQKVPKTLDVVQKIMIDKPNIQFILTGSSARKIKRGSGNLLAGRAFVYHLYPFSIFELKNKYNLVDILEWGGLPEIFIKKNKSEKRRFLDSYSQTYLKEEILFEQIIRNLNPFRSFLKVASQQNGEPINYYKIAQDINVDSKTVKNYFSILEDTLLGFVLQSYHRSIRKQNRISPKFYFFDTGVKRALGAELQIPLKKNTYAFGKAFEHHVILECHYLNEYLQRDFSFSYLRTKNQVEIDLVIERPGKKDLLVEIKSSDNIQERHLTHLVRFKNQWPKKCEVQVWSLEFRSKSIKGISCIFYKDALKKLFAIK